MPAYGPDLRSGRFGLYAVVGWVILQEAGAGAAAREPHGTTAK